MTKILKPSIEAISEAVHILLNDGIVIIPTIRWYMFCCKAENQECIERIFNAKERSLNKKPLFILPNKLLSKLFFKIENETEMLIEKLWPGELTLLLPWVDQNIASKYLAFDQTSALAISPPMLFGEIACSASIPLAATTVNTSCSLDKDHLGPALSIEEVLSFIKKSKIKIDIIIDGGICPAFNHTTIIDCSEGQYPKIIREGFVHERAIKIALSN
ncbi:MAG: Sua5/YciO/YrdC/YwlC family protein [Bacteroidetes bacterium]|nr:Sua5/YciO/YrdC/YwlC family protein [Bacteroidota bacterium]